MAMAHIVFFAKSNNIHLPFKDLGSIGMSIGPPMGSKGFILGFCEDRCKDSKGIDGILKDLYKDSSWISIGILQGFEGNLKHFGMNSIRISNSSL